VKACENKSRATADETYPHIVTRRGLRQTSYALLMFAFRMIYVTAVLGLALGPGLFTAQS
jgi:hypothetical protein